MYMIVMLIAAQSATVVPSLLYPISRARLARAIFSVSLLQWVGQVLGMIGLSWLVSLTGQIVTGQFLPGFGLPVLTAEYGTTAVLVLPVCFLSPGEITFMFGRVASTRGSGKTLGILSFVMAFGSVSVLSQSRASWLPLVLTPTGAAMVVGTGLLFVWVFRRHINRHYRTCDLPAAA